MLLSPKGRQINGDNLGRTWRRFGAVLKAHSVRLLKIHSTRHTFATLALEAGRLVTWVSAVLGHADPSFTMRVYAHAIPGGDRTAAQQLSERLRKATSTTTAPGGLRFR